MFTSCRMIFSLQGCLYAEYSSTSARFGSRPRPGREGSGRRWPASGSRAPSKSMPSTRTWSWKYSRCASVSTAQQACAETEDAQWAEKGIWRPLQIPSTRSRFVIPAQRVTSAWRMSTHPARSASLWEGPLVLTRDDGEATGAPVAQEAQALTVLRANGLFEVGDPFLSEAFGPVEGLLSRIGAVGVDQQLGALADSLPDGPDPLRVLLGLAPDLHFDAGDPLGDPAAELLPEPIGRVGGEPAAAVDRHGVVKARERVGERDLQELRLQVPEGDVDRRDGHRADAGTAGVADRALHRRPRRGRAHGVFATHRLGEL